MAAAGRSRAHSARPSHPQSAQRGGERLQTDSPYGREPASARREAEAREAAAAVAALPEHFSERFSIEKTPVAAAGRFPERRPIQQKEPAPVRPLWPSRPSTAEAACVGRVPGVGVSGSRGEHLGAGGRPSSAAALRRAAALCAEIENTRASEKQKRLTVDATSLVGSLVPLSELEEKSPVGAYAAASPSALAPMFGDETFAAVPEKGAREEEERVSFRGGRLTVAPAAAAPGPEGHFLNPSVGHEMIVDDDEEGDALARALRLCHSAAETAAGVAERLRSRDASSVPVSPGGTAGAAARASGGSGGETRFQTGTKTEDRSGDENDAPTSPAPASSPRLAPSPSRPGSAFGERSVRSSLERFRRRSSKKSAPDPEPAESPPAESPLPESASGGKRRTLRANRERRRNTETEPSDEDGTSLEDSESDEVADAVLETLLEELLVEERASDVRRERMDELMEEDASGSPVSESSVSAADDLRRAARVEALVAEMSATEMRGSRLIGAEAFGRLYDALARRAEAAAAAAAAMRESDASESESESESESDSDSERSEEGVRFPDRSSSPPFGEPGWCLTLGPFASSVTVEMTPRRNVTTQLGRHSALGDVSSDDGRVKDASEREPGCRTKKKKRSGRDRRRDDDANVRFAEAEVLALRYARLVSELEKVGRSREGTPECDAQNFATDCAVRLAAGGPTGK